MATSTSKTRLPLQIGVQSLYSLGVASALLVPGLLVLLATLFLLVLKGGFLVFLLFSQGWMVALGIVVVEIMLLARGVRHLRLALRTRPADVMLDDIGLHVVGGRLHGRAIAWSDCEAIAEGQEGGTDLDEVARASVVIEKNDGEKLVIAEAADASELASVRALRETVEARLHPERVAPVPPEKHPDMLHCPSCSAPAAPRDADETTCAFCGAKVPIPASLRERLRATNEVLASSKISAALLGKLLAQPSARHATLLWLVAGIPIAVIWFVAVWFGIALYVHHGLRTVNVLLMASTGMVSIAACYFVLRFALVNRMALGVITLDFGAFPPVKDGAPWTCRSCNAPLPPARDGLLARCAWCGSDNVLGVDLRPRAAGARKQRATLESAFARRSKDRRTYALRGAIAVAVLPLSVWGFVRARGPLTREAKLLVACDKGDVPKCVELGQYYASVTFDRAAAQRVFEDTCKRGSADGCANLGDLLASGDEQENARGVDLLWQACQKTDASWCVNLALVEKARHPKADIPPPLALFHRACDAGSATGCTLVGEELLRGALVAKDEAGAAKLFDQSCAKKYAYACADLALLYFDGIGVPKDVPRAIAMFQDGCKGKSPVYVACDGLARAYDEGRGVAKDARKAWDLTRQACEYGHVGTACTRIGTDLEAQHKLDAAFEHFVGGCPDDPVSCLGIARVLIARNQPDRAINVLHDRCLEDHVGAACALGGVWLVKGEHHVPQDEKAGAELYAAGCAANDPDSCVLGGQLADRQENYAVAREQLGRACEMREAGACNFLGGELEQGHGGPVDEAAAMAAYQRACDVPVEGDKHGAQDYGCEHAKALATKLGVRK